MYLLGSVDFLPFIVISTVHLPQSSFQQGIGPILILLLKDGDNATLAGGTNGNTAGYKILPYVGLGSATWSFKFEYDSSDSEYNSTTGNPNIFEGNRTGFGSATTDTQFFTVPSNPGTFQSLASFSGMAENGESLISDGSRVISA